jgi:hypothetical protein
MINPILKVTDGGISINLLNLRGWSLDDWNPAVPEAKSGGIFRSSPLADGRKLVYRKMDNIIDTFNLVGSGSSQNDMIRSIQELERLLEKAIAYWTSDWQNEPVWIEASGSCETEIRYATIVDYKLTGFGSPYKQPFFGSNSATEAILVIEHQFWQETKPGEDGNCVHLANDTDYPAIDVFDSGTFYPASDGTCSDVLHSVDLTNIKLGIGYGTTFPGNCKAGIIFNNVTIPSGATIVKALLSITYAGGTGTPKIKVQGQSQNGGAINSVTLVSGGKGYKEPYVEVKNPGTVTPGFDALIVADMKAGIITNLHIVYPGYGYINPIITIKDRRIAAYVPAVATATASTVNADATVLTGTNSDFLGRTLTIDTSTTIEFNIALTITQTFDITSIVREIINHSAWDSGDYLGLFLSLAIDSGGSSPGIPEGMVIVSMEGGVNKPALYIEWSTDVVPLGRETTCAQEVFIANKYNNAPIQYIFTFDASSGYSANLYGYDYTTTPLKLLPTTPAVGDMIYFGSTIGPFSSLVFDLYAVQTGITGVWEYSDAWDAFDVSGGLTNELCGDEQGFTKVGVGNIVWSQPDDWDMIKVNDGVYNVTGYWIRFRITAVSTPTPPYQWHRDIYTVMLPYIDISAEEIPGDTTALARILLNSESCTFRDPSNIVMGLRSLSRGSNFTAYLNASDVQQPIGTTFHIESSTVLVDDTTAPTGRSLYIAAYPYTSFNLLAYWNMSGNIGKEFIGTYHAYVRCKQVGIATGTVKLKLSGSTGGSQLACHSETNAILCGNCITYVDLGQLVVPTSYTMLPTDNYYGTLIYLWASADNSESFYIYDVILIPADEWAGNFESMESDKSYFSRGLGLDLDSIRNPRQYRASLMYLPDSTPVYSSELTRISSGEPMFQSNSDQRMWLFQYSRQTTIQDAESFIENCNSIRAERSARYLLYRGNR